MASRPLAVRPASEGIDATFGFRDRKPFNSLNSSKRVRGIDGPELNRQTVRSSQCAPKRRTRFRPSIESQPIFASAKAAQRAGLTTVAATAPLNYLPTSTSRPVNRSLRHPVDPTEFRTMLIESMPKSPQISTSHRSLNELGGTRPCLLRLFVRILRASNPTCPRRLFASKERRDSLRFAQTQNDCPTSPSSTTGTRNYAYVELMS
jgi:hypothetical protein